MQYSILLRIVLLAVCVKNINHIEAFVDLYFKNNTCPLIVNLIRCSVRGECTCVWYCTWTQRERAGERVNKTE